MKTFASTIVGFALVISLQAECATVTPSSLLRNKTELSVSNWGDTVTGDFSENPFVVSERPHIFLPDSLGGKELKGYVAIRLLFDSSAAICSYQVMRFKATAKKPNINIDYRFGEEKDRKKVSRYRKWLKSYVEQVRVKRITKIPLPHTQDEKPPKTFYLIISVDFGGLH